MVVGLALVQVPESGVCPASHRTWGFLFAWDMSKDLHEKRPSAALNENTFKELLENK